MLWDSQAAHPNQFFLCQAINHMEQPMCQKERAHRHTTVFLGFEQILLCGLAADIFFFFPLLCIEVKNGWNSILGARIRIPGFFPWIGQATWPTIKHRHHFSPRFLFGCRCWSWHLLECLSTQKSWGFSALTKINDSILIFVTQKHRSFLTYLNFTKIKSLKFLQFFQYIYSCLYGITPYSPNEQKSVNSPFSAHTVLWTDSYSRISAQMEEARGYSRLLHLFSSFSKSQGSTRALPLVPRSSCRLDPVRSCWKPLCKVRKLFLYWHWISLRWTSEDRIAMG